MRAASLPGAGWSRDEDEAMKLVIAVIKPFKLEEVREVLTAAGA